MAGMRDDLKIRSCIRIIGVAGAVYLVFRYLLPLTAPFLFAWLTALVLKPSSHAIARRLKVSWRGRSFGISAGVVGLVELAGLMVWVGALFYFGGRKMYQEMVMLANRFPWFLEQLDRYLTGICRQMEQALSLREDTMVCMARDMIRSLGSTVKQGVMPYLMGNSVSIAKYCIHCCIIMVLYAIGVMLFLQEMDGWKEKMEASVYCREYERVGRLLKTVANAYLRTQGIIMVLTSLVCMAGLFLLGNPYYILAGAGIGILDALPVFGTGTVLLPWAFFCFLKGSLGRGTAVLAIYLVCYFLREILEARLMAHKVGLTPLETLASIYVGLQLFGLFGFLLGPVGLLVVKEFAGKP